MQDLIYLAAIVLFFPVAFVFVAALGRLIGVGKTEQTRLSRSARAIEQVETQSHHDKVRAA
jgi:hypothetical protein